MFCFFNDTATTEIYTLSLHDALPICFAQVGDDLLRAVLVLGGDRVAEEAGLPGRGGAVHQLRDAVLREEDRKSTRLNSSHAHISYAVFCFKKKNTSQVHVRK